MNVCCIHFSTNAIAKILPLALFHGHFNERQEFEEASAESVYEVLDYFPSYFQNKELPTEYILTT
jgi:hypothetical protein